MVERYYKALLGTNDTRDGCSQVKYFFLVISWRGDITQGDCLGGLYCRWQWIYNKFKCYDIITAGSIVGHTYIDRFTRAGIAQRIGNLWCTCYCIRTGFMERNCVL
ncbi:hypothetical protein D3C87_1506780 [compost metagenome]